MSDNDKEKIPQFEVGPYVFPTLLAAFGLWCLYDGWISSDPKMQEYLLFNRIGSAILLPWAAIDFFRTWRINKAESTSKTIQESNKEADPSA